jgi:hypothetical protein
MLIYTQSAPDIARLAREIDAIAQLTGERDQMRITIDSADGFTWPWAWYLRNYQHVGYPDFATSPPAPDPLVTVAVVNARNNSVARPIYEDYHGGRRIVHRWWFREDGYRAVTWGTFFGTLFNRNEWRGSIDFFLYRKMDNPIGSVDSYLYVRDDVPMHPFR